MNTQQKCQSVSVVMSVFDRADLTIMTINSVLAQAEVELEFIIVSDGATQAVLDVLEDVQDERIRLIKQENSGQTNALIKGCSAATHDYIARIDAGDTMQVERLKLQSQFLAENPQVGMVSCWIRMHTIEGYYLYDICHSAKQLKNGLAATDERNFMSPFHASMMFRKSVYQQAGGYRSEFYFTQDCDLWTRMLPLAGIASIEKYLTNAIFSVHGISGRYADFQKQLVRLLVKRNTLRKNGLNDQGIFDEAKKLRPSSDEATTTKPQRFQALYFTASVLSAAKSPHAKDYWRQALVLRPLSLVSRIRWLASLRYSL